MSIIRSMSSLEGVAKEPDAAQGAESAWLRALGARLRAARLSMRVSAAAAAQSAGVSRPTWHRMEAGSPGVSAGAYARALDALGIASVAALGLLESTDTGSQGVADRRSRSTIPTRIRVGDWPELSALCWSLQPDTMLTPREAFLVYERNARRLSSQALGDEERALIEDLRTGLADAVHS